MGYLYQRKLKNGGRSRIWWVKYYVNGHPVRESTGTEKEKAARDFLKSREGRAADGAPVLPRADRVRYEEVADDLRRSYETTGKRNLMEAGFRLKRLGVFFANRRVVSITPPLITEYVATRQRAGAANGTINRELATLSRMLRLTYENGKLLRLPVIKRLAEADPREGFFEEDQYKAVRRHLPADLQVVAMIAHTYGWRAKSEILPLERRHLNLEKGGLRLDPGMAKNDDGRYVALTAELEIALAEQLARVDALQKRLGRIIPHLFPHLTGRHAGKPRRNFRKAWATACRKAGVPGRLVHDFRRTAVRNLERAGVARSVAMKITGHRTEAVYLRYAIVNEADIQAAVQKLTGTFSGTPAASVVESRPVTR
jgi:integrase